MVQSSADSLDVLKNFKPGDLTPLYTDASLKLQIDVILANYIAEVQKIAIVSQSFFNTDLTKTRKMKTLLRMGL